MTKYTRDVPTIREWPEEERPREKLVTRGAGALSNAELVAILLRTGNASTCESALDQARRLLSRFGNIRRLCSARVSEICQVKGIGMAKAVQVLSAGEIGRRMMSDKIESGQTIQCAAEVFQYFRGTLARSKKEIFAVILLDTRGRVIRHEKIAEGSLDAAVVHPREAFIPAVRESAASVIFVHNHPSGDPRPSDRDREITFRLQDAGRVLGINVLDHVILGEERYYSFMEEGTIAKI
ncbi:MAG: DNA repair protein RadC [Deltaproteobacteria bacterium]|nr:DNA repair protein RadC [Deltaproteobacteria bacterium]